MTVAAKLACNPTYFIPRETCPVCGGSNAMDLHKSSYIEAPVRGFVESHYRDQGVVNFGYLDGTDFVLSDCPDCGTLYQRNIPNDFLLDKIYNEMSAPESVFDRAMRDLTVAEFETISGELVELFLRVGKPPKDVRFLDYGFGYGNWARVAVALGAKVYATEISPDKIAYAQEIGVRIIHEQQWSSLEFDIVHTEQVFEHLSEPRHEFRKLAKLVAPGGIMKVAVPPARNIRKLLKSRGMSDTSPLERTWRSEEERRQARASANYMCVAPLEHLNTFSVRSMEALARETDLVLLSNVRKQAVPVSIFSMERFRQTATEFAKVAAKVAFRTLLRRDSGYYLFKRV
jgi:SAM-dependent methyltransferase